MSVAVLLLVSSILGAVAAAAQTLTFSRDDYASSSGARAIVAADFNRDGWLDVAHANTGRNSVTVLLGRAGAGLTRSFEIPVGAGPFAMVTADFNRDGIADIAVTNADGHSISILLGAGDGSFPRRVDIATPSRNPRGLVAADVNKDGKTDLVYAAYATRSVHVLIGKGDGTFAEGASYTSAAAQPQGLAVADFDRDGYMDVAVAYDSAAGLTILYGNGGSGFRSRQIPGNAPLNAIAAADLNGDGYVDIVATSIVNGRVTIFLNSAAGLTQKRAYATGASPRDVAIADLNGDGLLDIVTANRTSSTATVLLGDPSHRGAFLAGLEIAAGQGSRAVATGDFNADGRLDLAIANQESAAVTVLSNATVFERAAYAFARRSLGTPTGRVGGADNVWPADFDGDGKMDVVTLAREDPWTMVVLYSDGRTIALPGEGARDQFLVADLNADGRPDIVYKNNCCTPASIATYLGDAGGGFVQGPETTASIGVMSFAAGDLNRDAIPDLVAIGWDAGRPIVQVMIGKGDGSFKQGARAPIDPPDNVPGTIIITDVNRDGKPDVAIALDNGVLHIWHGDGAGGLSPAATMVFAMGTFDLKFADINHDGYADAVVDGDGRLGIALGSSRGFLAPAYLPVSDWGFRSSRFAIADINLDGNLDIVRAGGEILPGRGDGTFGPIEAFDLAGTPSGFPGVGIAVVDFTGDGLPDIVFGTSQGEVGILVNRRTNTNRPPVVTAGPDRTIPYQDEVDGNPNLPQCPTIEAVGTDPDMHALRFEWRDQAGKVVSTSRALTVCGKPPGVYRYSMKVEDGRGAVVTDALVVTVAPTKEIVLHLGGDEIDWHGSWSQIYDPAVSPLTRAYNANLGAPKVAVPSATPANFIRLGFVADPTQTYKLWLRLRADNNSWANDSVWVQFTGSTDLSGVPKYRSGTASALAVSLEECVNCGVAGWGWQDDGFGAINRNGVLLRFPAGGYQQIVIQTREDGVSIDQIVLSSDKYLTTRPGLPKNDQTILRATF